MMEGPFWNQKATRLTNQRKIITTIAGKPSTFSELLKTVGLSRPILTKYLRQLESEGTISRKISGRRIEYQLTGKGRGAEELRRQSIGSAFDVMKQIIGDYEGTKALFEMAKIAKQDPALAEAFLQFMQSLMLVLVSDDTLRWIKKHPPDEQKRIFSEEVKKRTPVGPPPEDPAEMIAVLQSVPKIIKEIITSDNKR